MADWKPDTATWIMGHSHSLSGGAESGMSLSGHMNVTVNGTVAAMMFLGLIVMIFFTLYLMNRVYRLEGKKLGKKLREEMGLPDPNVSDNDGIDIDVEVEDLDTSD
jgi:hypothetical protein